MVSTTDFDSVCEGSSPSEATDMHLWGNWQTRYTKDVVS